MTSEQFELISHLALELTGIEILDRHRHLLDRKCSWLGIEKRTDLSELLGRANEGDRTACQHLIVLLTTSHTSFYRVPWHFDIAAEQALWAVHKKGHARFWSAAAATGEEPYSLAIALLNIFRRDDPSATILATDINPDSLAFAQRGVYGEPALAALPPSARSHFPDDSTASGPRRVSKAVQRLVTFQALNLNATTWPINGPFDVIFCRNVLMYFKADLRDIAVRRFASLLVPGGLLILDPAEHLGRTGHLFSKGKESIYTLLRPLPHAFNSGADPSSMR